MNTLQSSLFTGVAFKWDAHEEIICMNDSPHRILLACTKSHILTISTGKVGKTLSPPPHLATFCRRPSVEPSHCTYDSLELTHHLRGACGLASTCIQSPSSLKNFLSGEREHCNETFVGTLYVVIQYKCVDSKW